MSTEQVKFYDCDPFIRGQFPDVQRPGYDESPLRTFSLTLNSGLIGPDGSLVAPAGTRAFGLGFTRPLLNAERREPAIRGFLVDAGTAMRDIEDVLTGVTLVDSPDDLAAIRAYYGHELPSLVIAHTGRAIAEVAIRDFGFSPAANVDTMPLQAQSTIVFAGHEPATVYMPTEDFLAMPTPSFEQMGWTEQVDW